MALLVILQVADEISGVVGCSRCKAKNAVGQRCTVEAKVSFIEHWSTQKGLEVCADWWGAPERFAEHHLLGCGKVDQVVQAMSGQKDRRGPGSRHHGAGIDGGPGCRNWIGQVKWRSCWWGRVVDGSPGCSNWIGQGT